MQRIVPTVFNESTHNTLPSISPREEGDRKLDVKSEKSNARFTANHPELFVLMTYMESQILRDKPEDIVDYLRYFFSPENEDRIKTAIHDNAGRTSTIEDDIKSLIKPIPKSRRK